MVAYLDSAQDRLVADADRSFSEAVEAVRLGTVFAHDVNAYSRWKTRPKPGNAKGLTGAALESAIMNIARMFPDNVVTA